MTKNCTTYQVLVAAVVIVCLMGCAEQSTPSRDHIPLIKEKLSFLQNGVLAKNPAAID